MRIRFLWVCFEFTSQKLIGNVFMLQLSEVQKFVSFTQQYRVISLQGEMKRQRIGIGKEMAEGEEGRGPPVVHQAAFCYAQAFLSDSQGTQVALSHCFSDHYIYKSKANRTSDPWSFVRNHNPCAGESF